MEREASSRCELARPEVTSLERMEEVGRRRCRTTRRLLGSNR